MYRGNVLKELFVEVTNNCLMYCRHCSSEASASNQEYIPALHLYRLIDEGVSLGVECFSISGGEPFLYKDLFSVLKYARSKGLKLIIYSCGIVDNGKQLVSFDKELISRIKDVSPLKMVFSIHGACSETHEYITRIKGSYDLAVDSIKSTIATGISAELHFVPMKFNYKEISGVVALAASLGIKQVSLLRLVFHGRCKEDVVNLMINGNEAVEIINIVKQLERDYSGVKIRLGAPFNCVKDKDITRCTASQSKLLISATGEVFPCEAFKSLKGTRSTIYDHSLEYLWYNDELLNDLRNLCVEDVTFCASCPIQNTCHGGCPGERMLFNKHIAVGPDPWCRLYS